MLRDGGRVQKQAQLGCPWTPAGRGQFGHGPGSCISPPVFSLGCRVSDTKAAWQSRTAFAAELGISASWLGGFGVCQREFQHVSAFRPLGRMGSGADQCPSSRSRGVTLFMQLRARDLAREKIWHSPASDPQLASPETRYFT